MYGSSDMFRPFNAIFQGGWGVGGGGGGGGGGGVWRGGGGGGGGGAVVWWWRWRVCGQKQPLEIYDRLWDTKIIRFCGIMHVHVTYRPLCFAYTNITTDIYLEMLKLFVFSQTDSVIQVAVCNILLQEESPATNLVDWLQHRPNGRLLNRWTRGR
jgi:hypothetical protein